MGVRFECPNGHKLNVKAELAGKRGICPECQVRFIVPAFSGEQAQTIDAPAAAAPAPPSPTGSPSGTERVQEPATSKVAPARSDRSPPTAGEAPAGVAPPMPMAQTFAPAGNGAASPPRAEPIVWYLRPAAGGQYGPATDEVFQQWIAEGRVAADAWIWRTGWPEWQPGGAALAAAGAVAEPAAAAGSAPATEAPPIMASAGMILSAASAPSTVGPQPTTPSKEGEPSLAEARRAAIRRRKRRVQAISILLGVVALVMAVVLVIVLNRPPAS